MLHVGLCPGIATLAANWIEAGRRESERERETSIVYHSLAVLFIAGGARPKRYFSICCIGWKLRTRCRLGVEIDVPSTVQIY